MCTHHNAYNMHFNASQQHILTSFGQQLLTLPPLSSKWKKQKNTLKTHVQTKCPCLTLQKAWLWSLGEQLIPGNVTRAQYLTWRFIWCYINIPSSLLNYNKIRDYRKVVLKNWELCKRISKLHCSDQPTWRNIYEIDGFCWFSYNCCWRCVVIRLCVDFVINICCLFSPSLITFIFENLSFPQCSFEFVFGSDAVNRMYSFFTCLVYKIILYFLVLTAVFWMAFILLWVCAFQDNEWLPLLLLDVYDSVV